MSQFLLHFSTKHSFCLVVLGNNDDDKIYLKFSFFYVTLIGTRARRTRNLANSRKLMQGKRKYNKPQHLKEVDCA